MIIESRFTWGHIPRTGGDATRVIFERTSLNPTIIPSNDQAKHLPFGAGIDRTPSDTRIYLANLRRLPHWVVAVYWYQMSIGWFQQVEGIAPPVASLDEFTKSGFGDTWLRFLTQYIQPDIRFLRMEHLVEDIQAFLEDLGEKDAVETPGHVNCLSYPHDTKWLTDEQVRLCYETNPVWREYERRAYGDILEEWGDASG